MKNPLCPNCRAGIADVVDRTIVDGGLRVCFECERCEYSWTVTF